MLDQSYSSNHIQKKVNVFTAWFLASRPKTLIVAFSPILVGATFASRYVENLNWILIISSLLCALSVQIGMNFINDALDFNKGKKWTKQLHLQRSHLLSTNQFLFGGYFLLACVLLFGIPLILAGGWLITSILLLSIACGYFYTGGPFPLSYTGTSEGFILIFYGWISTGIVYYLQTQTVIFDCLLAGTQIGLLTTVPHAINNLRDIQSDALVHKRTLAVRFGPYFARWEITLLSLIPFLLNLIWLYEGEIATMVLPFLVFPLVLYHVKAIWQTDPGSSYNIFLAKSAFCQLVFACLLALGYKLG